MPVSTADRNLLYGVLALQLGFVTREALVAGVAAWAEDRERPLGDVLVERGAVAAEDHPVVELAVARHVEKQQDETTATVGVDDLSFELSPAVRGMVATVIDADLQATFAHLGVPAGSHAAGREREATVVWGSSRGEEEKEEKKPVPGAVLPGEDPAAASAAQGSRYRVVRPHAKGGLGEVKVAWDAELKRDVALKEIRSEFASNERARVRFLREAEVNGNLEHPGVVPVYGLGAHADGRPYYAMRFVQGETLQQALERYHREARTQSPAERTLHLRQLLRRFTDVCNVIEYAHSRGVLHRDLKPANVLLGKFGETLIIDWGLAKVIGRPDDDRGGGDGPVEPLMMISSDGLSLPTMIGETLGSPPYMSPEQARGRHGELDYASDVYSLGATLFCVLTGRPPVTAATTSETLARVSKGEIDRPRAVRPDVPPALEAVCLKALAFEPKARHRSASELAADIERWLADQPVAVYKDPLSTRLLRWARRRRTLVTTTAAVLVVGLVGSLAATAVVSRQKARVEEALEQTEAARKEAREHLAVGLDVVDQLVTFGDRQILTQLSTADRAKFLEAAGAFIRKFREQSHDDPAIQARSGLLARRLGNLNRLTGKYAQADGFYDEAVAALNDLLLRTGDPAHRDLLAETLLDQADAQLVRGRAAAAESASFRAQLLASTNAEADPRNVGYQRTLGRALHSLAQARHARGGSDAAAQARKAVTVLQPLADAALPDLREQVLNKSRILPLSDQLELVHALVTLSRASGEAGTSEPPLRQAFERIDGVADTFQGRRIPDVDYYHAWTAVRLARAQPAGDGNGRAAALLRAALLRLKAIASKSPDIVHFRIALADALAARAALGARKGPPDEARNAGDEARTLADDLIKVVPDLPEPHQVRAAALAALAELPPRPGDDESPRSLLARAVEAQQAALDFNPDDPEARRALDDLKTRTDAPSK